MTIEQSGAALEADRYGGTLLPDPPSRKTGL